jgi:hypothetical protein
MRGEVRDLGREVGDGVPDRPGHVEARLLGRRAGPARPAAQSGGPLELCDQRVALGAPLRQPVGVAVDRGVVQRRLAHATRASHRGQRGQRDALDHLGYLAVPPH